MRTVKIGVVGCGNISNVYLANFASNRFPNLQIVAVADMIQEKAEEQAEKFGITNVYTVAEMMDDPEIEIVVNLTNPAAHEEINVMALEAGKHVYSEKPLATTMEGLKHIMDTAGRAGLQVGCAPDTFYGGIWQTARKLLDDGWIGVPTAGTVNTATHGHDTWHPDPQFHYEAGGGPVLDNAIYSISALVYLLGPVESVFCEAMRGFDERTIYSPQKRGQKMHVDIDTHYSALVKFKDGTIVNLLISWDVWFSQIPAMEIHGTEGSLLLPNPAWHNADTDSSFDPTEILRGEKIINMVKDLEGYDAGDVTVGTPTWPHADTFPILFSTSGHRSDNLRGIGTADMAHAIAEGGTFRTNGEFAVHCTEVLLGFDISAKEGRPYMVQSSCCRPEQLPLGSPEGVFS